MKNAIKKAEKIARKAIEATYDGLCTIYEFQEIKVGAETRLESVLVVKDEPCTLSKKTINSAGQGEVAAQITYAPMLFIAPEIEVKPGSQIVVTQNGVTREFSRSGEPFVYATHQELILQRVDKA